MRHDSTLRSVIRSLNQYGDRPAIIAFGKEQPAIWSFADLLDHVQRLASGLAQRGMVPGTRVALWAPNRPEWVIACLALVQGGAIPVPVDAQIGDEDLRHILQDSEAHWGVTTTPLAQRLVDLNDALTLILLDANDEDPRAWRRYVSREPGDLPRESHDQAVLFYTSGTSGPPKGVPLLHRNLMANLQALLEMNLIRRNDRLLLPLPLHHVYPFMVGMLTALASGVTIVFPLSLTGPQILRVLQEGRVTVFIGVPRMYEALFSAIQTRMRQRGRIVFAIFQFALALSKMFRRRLALRLGLWLFAPLRTRMAPHLRMMVSGGSALDAELGWTFEALGWQVASGYGLTETSPILTLNLPGQGIGTAGKPLKGVEICIAEPEKNVSHGEVIVKGANVFNGYLHLPEKTNEAFTDQGYFRTGDLGYFDEEGFLHLAGRTSSMIVLPGGENIWPEKLEAALEQSERIREAGVLEHDGRLVALLVPKTHAMRHHDSWELERLLRHEVDQELREFPSHHRITEYVISLDVLPRTRLGKIRRHELKLRYKQAKQQGGQRKPETGPIPREEMSPEDRELLDDPTAKQVWDWLIERFSNVRLTPDSNVQLDLGIDSLEWLTLTLEIRERMGIDLNEESIGRIQILRDLLREASEVGKKTSDGRDPFEQLQDPEHLLDDQQRRWLKPAGAVGRSLGAALFTLNRLLMRWAFHVEVEGLKHLPKQPPFLITPNHVSLLDPLAIAAALPDHILEHTYWAGWVGIMFRNRLMRLISHATHVVPIDPFRGPLASLAVGAAVLARGGSLVWFSEGERSWNGTLQPFQLGIGVLLRAQPVPAVPVWIAGTYEALPRGTRWPHLHPITVTFGEPLIPEDLEAQPTPRIAKALHERVAALKGKEIKRNSGP